MPLVQLDTDHAAALEGFVAEFAAAGERIHGWFCPDEWPIERQVATVDAWSRGERLQPGWVPCTTWFWEQDGDLLGVINLRHTLTDALHRIGGHIGYSVRPSARGRGIATQMLAATLPHAWALGIERALLTCDPANRGSARTIEKNGGVPFEETFERESGEMIRRYWIDRPT